MPFVANSMDKGPRDFILSESQRKEQYIYPFYLWNLNTTQKNISTEKESLYNAENSLWLPKEERRWGEERLGAWD